MVIVSTVSNVGTFIFEKFLRTLPIAINIECRNLKRCRNLARLPYSTTCRKSCLNTIETFLVILTKKSDPNLV